MSAHLRSSAARSDLNRVTTGARREVSKAAMSSRRGVGVGDWGVAGAGADAAATSVAAARATEQ